eukprot:scaffold64677_cov30-Tisochrysis_lutea.AAC.7
MAPYATQEVSRRARQHGAQPQPIQRPAHQKQRHVELGAPVGLSLPNRHRSRSLEHFCTQIIPCLWPWSSTRTRGSYPGSIPEESISARLTTVRPITRGGGKGEPNASDGEASAWIDRPKTVTVTSAVVPRASSNAPSACCCEEPSATSRSSRSRKSIGPVGRTEGERRRTPKPRRKSTSTQTRVMRNCRRVSIRKAASPTHTTIGAAALEPTRRPDAPMPIREIGTADSRIAATARSMARESSTSAIGSPPAE